MSELTQKLLPVAGVRMAAVAAGIRKLNRLDLVLFELAEGSNLAAIFTRNVFCAAPVLLAKKHLQSAEPAYLLINTGNANAGTGAAGMQAAQTCCDAVAAAAAVDSERVLPFSTGVIGEPLPVEKILAALPQAFNALTTDAWPETARAIMTTDTRPKALCESLQVAGKTITITGIAKGAGMIKPNMATMLGFVFTDLGIGKDVLQNLLQTMADRSFNRITVDGDTSTNDSCVLVATGGSGLQIEALEADERRRFEQALYRVFAGLARELIRDAEGASKFVSIRIEGGRSSAECLQIAYAIAESPLVKTALFASDPNWGRILAAAGRAGIEDLDINALQIWLGDVCIVEDGGRSPSYREEQGQAIMNQAEISITLKLGRGKVSEEIWTCDLSHDYVTINAEYRT